MFFKTHDTIHKRIKTGRLTADDMEYIKRWNDDKYHAVTPDEDFIKIALLLRSRFSNHGIFCEKLALFFDVDLFMCKSKCFKFGFIPVI
jgi:hypothetical protein